MLRLSRWFWVSSVLITVTILITYCQTSSDSPEMNNSPYRNTKSDATYVGIESCRTCHENVYQSFIQTGMGQSFDLATKEKSAANFDPSIAHVYDSHKNLHYRPYWDGDTFKIKEYRLEGSDTVYKRTEIVKYIIGSGQHTNSHIIDIHGYLYQAPITFYTQKGVWDLAPGFDGGSNSRWDRKIQLECMTCHNAMPKLQEGSLNKFLEVGKGIDCERCHGPGSIHVQEKKSGIMVDTSLGPDYSIVNPRRLDAEAQNNICMRCHLQGVTVLADHHTFYDYRPGMTLSDIMTTFLPSYSGADDKLIMASHVERMKMSQCYKESGKLSCVTCHNPHISVKQTPIQQFNDKCIACHPSTSHPNMDMNTAKNKNCVSCHMPKTGSIDIPHVAVTDHYIRKTKEQNDATQFHGIVSYNNKNVNAITEARGYLELYERYIRNASLLDSAAHYLNSKNRNDEIRLLYLRENYALLHQEATKDKPEAISDAWTSYRLGEGCMKMNDLPRAQKYFARAQELMPYVGDFATKNGVCLLILGRDQEGVEILKSTIQEEPNNYLAFYNLYQYYINHNNQMEAQKYQLQAKQLNPDM